MNPNPEQIKSAIRWVIGTFGSFFAGWFAAKGWFTIDQVLTVLNNETLIGLAAAGITFVWGLIVHKQVNALAVVAKMAEDPANPVKPIVLEPTPAGIELKRAVDSPAVVLAGTPAAATVAKATP